jgi:hypothetical protein
MRDLILMAEEKKDKRVETENELKRQLEELKKEVENLKREKEEAVSRSALLKETAKALGKVDVSGFGILGGLIDGIASLAELADKVQDPKNPLHKKLKVEYAIRTSGLLGDRYIASGRPLVAGRQEGRAPEPVARPEERRRIMEEIRELRKLKEQFLKAEKEAKNEGKEGKAG